jgi:hypothetical protein
MKGWTTEESEIDSRYGKEMYSFLAFSPTLGATQSCIQWVTTAVSSGIKLQGREARHLSPSSAEVSNSGAVLPRLHYVLLNDDKGQVHLDLSQVTSTSAMRSKGLSLDAINFMPPYCDLV